MSDAILDMHWYTHQNYPFNVQLAHFLARL